MTHWKSIGELARKLVEKRDTAAAEPSEKNRGRTAARPQKG